MNRVLISTKRFERDARNLIRKRPQARDDFELALGLLAEDAFHPSLKTHKLRGALEGSFACSVTRLADTVRVHRTRRTQRDYSANRWHS
jgi:mRNA-degrading endonuclease YafQ of YafQ-DinJ toxin-antitoxin module